MTRSRVAMPSVLAVAAFRVAMSYLVDFRSRQETIVVVPCYNEAQRIDADAFGRFVSESTDVTLLLVDDGSTDDTPLVLDAIRRRQPAKFATLRLEQNSGKAEAVRRGLQAALERDPTYVGYWDADLATPLETILSFRHVLRQRPELSLVMGARIALLGRQIHRTGVRHLLGRAFATAASVVLGLPVYDTQCGAKLFRASDQLASVFATPFQTRWIFDVEILARLMLIDAQSQFDSLKTSVYEYPLERWKDVRGSRLKARDFVRAGLDLAGIHWRYMRNQRKLLAARRSVIHTEQQGTSGRRNAA